MSQPPMTFRVAAFIARVCARLIGLCALGIGAAIAVGSAQPVMAVTLIPDFYYAAPLLLVDLQHRLVVTVPTPIDSTAISYSPDGQTLIALHDNRRVAFSVRTGRIWPLPGAGSSVTAWSPDGHYFAYNSLDHDALFIWDARSGVAREIHFEPIISLLYWSPRHHGLVIISATRLYTVDVAASRITALTPPEIMVCPTVTWSPDQAQVVMSVRAVEQYFNQVLDAGSGHVIAQVEAQHCPSFARWSPDASQLLIETWRGYAVWNPARSDYVELEALSASAGYMKIGDPVWSPDSRWLAFARAAYQPMLDPRDASLSTPELIITDLAQEHVWPLPAESRVDLSWSPDGRWVAAEIIGRDRRSMLRLFPASGGSPWPVGGPMGGGVDAGPVHWMKDGRLVAYEFTTNQYASSGPVTTLQLLTIRPGQGVTRHIAVSVPGYLVDVILWPQEEE